MKKYEIKNEVKTFKRHTIYFNYLIKNNVILCFSKKEGFNMKVYFNKNVKESCNIKAINDFIVRYAGFKERITKYKSFLNNSHLRNYKEFKVLNYVKL